MALPVAQPADASRQALEGHPLLGEAEPALQWAIVGEEGPDRRSVAAMSAGSPLRASQRNGPFLRRTAAADRRGRTPGRRRRRRSRRARPRPQVVAVVEDLGPGLPEADHGLAVPGHRGPGRHHVGVPVLTRRAAAASSEKPAGTYPFSGSWAEVWSVTMSISTPRRSSSGNTSAAFPSTPMESARPSRLASRARATPRPGCRHSVEVARLQTAADAGRVHLTIRATPSFMVTTAAGPRPCPRGGGQSESPLRLPPKQRSPTAAKV